MCQVVPATPTPGRCGERSRHGSFPVARPMALRHRPRCNGRPSSKIRSRRCIESRPSSSSTSMAPSCTPTTISCRHWATRWRRSKAGTTPCSSMPSMRRARSTGTSGPTWAAVSSTPASTGGSARVDARSGSRRPTTRSSTARDGRTKWSSSRPTSPCRNSRRPILPASSPRSTHHRR
ncbi:hypothetical protein D3C71_1454200 [compost metagenome]